MNGGTDPTDKGCGHRLSRLGTHRSGGALRMVKAWLFGQLLADVTFTKLQDWSAIYPRRQKRN